MKTKHYTVVVGWGPLFRKSPKILMKWEPIFVGFENFVPACLAAGFGKCCLLERLSLTFLNLIPFSQQFRLHLKIW